VVDHLPSKYKPQYCQKNLLNKIKMGELNKSLILGIHLIEYYDYQLIFLNKDSSQRYIIYSEILIA
jgi:hypothetical protein